MKMLRTVSAWLERHLYHGSTDKGTRLRKKMLAAVFGTSLILLLPTAVVTAGRGAAPFHLAFFLIRTILSIFVMAYLLLRPQCSILFTEIAMISIGILASVVTDFRTYRAQDTWAYAVVATDLLLLSNASGRAVSIMRGTVYVYLTVVFFFSLFEWDVYDHIPKLSATERWVDTRGKVNHMWSYFNRLAVFTLDFLLTRYFAQGMMQEQRAMEQSIELAETIAHAMVRFDLEAAEKGLATADAPSALHAILHRLLNNLKLYRPYLPDALFVDDGVTPEVHSPPQGNIAIVFTDIVSSTVMWDKRPASMKKAMVTYSRVTRENTIEFDGYEVKVIGDAFMVAFQNSLNACRFALSLHTSLYEASWPDELLELDVCATKAGIWNGPRVRMGVHCGAVEMHLNPITGRADYLGPEVNIAARLEQCAWSGTVAVSSDVMSELGVRGLRDLENPEVKALGVKELKGVTRGVQVSLLVPHGLRDRFFCRPTDQSQQQNEQSSRRLSLSRSSKSSSLRSDFMGLVSGGGPVAAQLRKSHGTVVAVRIEFAFLAGEASIHETLNDIMCAVLDSVGRTNGVLVSVSSSTLVASWNISKACSSHSSQSARFASLLKACMRESNFLMGITVGINTGGVLHGSVGSAHQLYMMAIGQCLELAGGLAAAASDLGTFALVGASAGYASIAQDTANKRATRKVDVWRLGGFTMDVHELNVDALTRWGVAELSKWGWSDSYATAFELSDYRTILHHADEDEDDVLQKVGRLLKRGEHLRWPFPVSIVVR